jgi:hypothetical protein
MENRNEAPKFGVHCDAKTAGHLRVATESLSVHIGQRIRRDGAEEIWDSVLVCCEEGEDGALGIQVMVFHPEWEEGRQVAFIESRPRQRETEVPILAIHAEGL